MSTTGHYTRYINQENTEHKKIIWSDNCDSMYQPVFIPGIHLDCTPCDNACKCTEEKKIELCPVKLGYFTIEHMYGNKRAFLFFRYDNDGYEKYSRYYNLNYAYDEKMSSINNPDYIGPLRRGSSFTLIDYEGNLAIQKVIKDSYNIKISDLIDRIFKNEFYNRSYVDYFRYYQEIFNHE